MSVYIKGMEMPTECGRCNAAFPNGVDYSCCLIKGYPLISSQRSTRLKNCPLIPVPDHGDLIERDALEEDAQKRLLICAKYNDQFQKPYEVMRAIALAPTIIPAEPPKEESNGV